MSCDETALSSGVLVAASCFSACSWSRSGESKRMGLLEMSRRMMAVVAKRSSGSCPMLFSAMSSSVSLWKFETVLGRTVVLQAISASQRSCVSVKTSRKETVVLREQSSWTRLVSTRTQRGSVTNAF